MSLGRLFHYTFDAVLLSTVLAGVKRSSGYTPDLTQISNSTAKSAAETYLGFGESIFGMIQASAVNSSYFTNKK
ncbi:DUF1748-domain-containing protein [Rhodocollybia butyracea]|uniref:DUF1748-domain-containing protein n=1 Tax=Rhodocollybia butyracea TaxID=206335 RepID=A0A9P5TYT4_9AGAR|nr:DUF1748-domain-containing protein [Rhodocollybia butyracea]KAF9059554.1 DUF1748-domain-containing protein [Rhodocollybia butyracea]